MPNVYRIVYAGGYHVDSARDYETAMDLVNSSYPGASIQFFPHGTAP